MLYESIRLLLTHLFLIFLIICSGHYFLRSSFRNISLSPKLVLSISYLLGVSFLVVLLKTITFFLHNAWVSLLIFLVVATILVFFELKFVISNFTVIYSKTKIICFILICFTLLFIILISHLPSSIKEISSFTSIGSLHSVRYAWITNTIFSYNDILSLPQNTVQSLLAYATCILSFKLPYVSLSIWLFTTLLFFILFIWGIIENFSTTRQNIIIGLLIFFLGNTALSVNHLLVVDSGSPFLLVGISDTIFGSYSFFFILASYFYISIEFRQIRSISFFVIISYTLVLGLNYFSAPQNIVILYITLFCKIIFDFLSKKQLNQQDVFLFGILFFSSILFIPQGGMLTPKFFLSKFNYSGVLSPSGNGNGITINLDVPYIVCSFNHLNLKPENYQSYNFISDYCNDRISFFEFIKKIYLGSWNFEQSRFEVLRVYFFILLGIVYLNFRLKINNLFLKVTSEQQNSRFNSTNMSNSLNFMGKFGIISFLIGFLICSIFSFNGYKWELTRFMIPSISIGLLGLVFFFIEVLSRISKRYYLVVFTFLIFLFFGPITYMFGNILIIINAYLNNGEFHDLIDIYFGSGPHVFY